MTTALHSSIRSRTSSLAFLLFLGAAALGCAADVGAPLGDAPYDDVVVALPDADAEANGVSAVTQALGTEREGAWLTSQYTSSSHRVTANTWNSKGGDNFVEHLSTGRYRAHLEHLEFADGNVQVVAYGSDSTRCKTDGWGPNSTHFDEAVAVSVRCHDTAGNPADSRFVMVFLGKDPGAESYHAGYAWNGNPTGSSTAHSRFSDVDSGLPIEITRLAKGRYSVRFESYEETTTGFAHVTAYGPLAEYCTISGIGLIPGAYGADVAVDCFNTTGARADARFSLFWHGFSMWEYPDIVAVYANRETTEEYEPGMQTGFWITTMTAYRTGPGQYSWEPVDFTPRTPLTTARSNSGRYCKTYSRNNTSVSVRCYTPNGARADTDYFGTAFEFPEL